MTGLQSADLFAGQADPFAGMVAAPAPDSGEDGGARPLTIYLHSPQGGAPSPVAANGDPFAGKPDPFASMATAAQTAPHVTTMGTAAQMGASGLSEGAIGVLGAPVDLTTGAINLGLKALGKKPITAPFGGSQSIKSALGYVDPRLNPDYSQPQNEAERIIKGAGAGIGASVVPVGMAGALGENALAAAEPFVGPATTSGVATNAALGAASGAGSQIASDAVPEPYKRLAATIGGLGAGTAGAVAGAVPGLVREGAGAVHSLIEPMTAAGPQAIADRTFAQGTIDRGSALEALNEHLENPPLVPGSQPTTFQVTGDMGQGNMERAAETVSPAPFNTRRAEQNAARVGVVNNLQATGDPAAISSHIRGQLAKIDADSAQSVNDAAAAAQERAGAIGGTGTPEEYGSNIRSALSSANDAAKAKESALWKAVDPDGTLALPAAPVSTKAKSVASGVGDLAKPLSGEEKDIFQAASSLPPVVKFNDLTDLRSRVSAEMRNQIGPNGNAVSYGRLSQLRSSIEDAINNAVEHKAALEQNQVARGEIQPDETIESRLQAWNDESARQTSMGSRGVGPERSGAASEAGAPGLLREESEGSGRYGGASSDSGLSAGIEKNQTAAQSRPRAVKPPQSLLGFLRKAGGIKDVSGNLRAQDMHLQYPGIINNKTGLDPDMAREAAAEAGYLGHDIDRAMSDTTENDLWDAIANHPVYSAKDADQLQAHQDWIREQEIRGHAADVRKNLAVYGDKPSPELVRRAAEIMADTGKPWADAIESASIQSEDEDFNNAAPRGPSESGSGVSQESDEGAERGQEGLSSQPRKNTRSAGEYLAPNIDDGAAQRLKQASSATKERAQTFKQGAVGQTLATQGTKDNFKLLNSAVGQKFWRPGPTGADAVRTLAKATPDAVSDLANYAALSLRKAALKQDGTIDPSKFTAWQKAHGDALRALGEVSPDTAAKFADAAKASEAVADVSAARSAALDDYQKSSLGKFLKVTDPADVTKTVGGIFGKPDSVQQMRRLSKSVADNPDARDGLRKSIADYISNKFISNREAGTSGVNAMKGDPFQTFVRENRPVLGQVFKPEEIKAMEAVASDIARSNRSIDAVKLPGRSNTPQDLIKALQKSGSAHLSPFAEMMAAGAAGYELGGVKGALLGGGAAYAKGVLSSMRAAGISKASDLVNQMLLHPALARAALERAPATAPKASAWNRFRDQLNRVAAINANRMVSGPSGQ